MSELARELYALFEKYGYRNIVVEEKHSRWNKRLVFEIRANRPRSIERDVSLTFTD